MGKFIFAWMASGIVMSVPILAAETGATSQHLDGLLMPLSNLGSTGFVVWFAWYTITRTLPGLSEKYEAGLKSAFEEAKQAREEFRVLITSMSEAHQRCAAEHRLAIDKLTASIVEMVRHCGGRVRQIGTDSTERSIG